MAGAGARAAVPTPRDYIVTRSITFRRHYDIIYYTRSRYTFGSHRIYSQAARRRHVFLSRYRDTYTFITW